MGSGDAVPAQVDAGHATPEEARSRELEQLLRLGSALEVGMDSDAFRRTLAEHLRPLIGRRAIRLVLDAGERPRAGAMTGAQPGRAPAGGGGAWESFPLVAGDVLVGSLDVAHESGGRRQPLSGRQRRLLELASPMLARAVRNAQLYRRVRRRGAVDDLTGCLTAAHGRELLDLELRRARRYARPTALLFVDLDCFKQVNTRFGHAGGDAVLRAVGAALRCSLRGSDLCCRHGGDEFLVLLPETPFEGALHAADRLRMRVAASGVGLSDGTVVVTASVGVAAARPGELDATGLIARADAAMYQAKRAGGNAVHAVGAPPLWHNI